MQINTMKKYVWTLLASKQIMSTSTLAKISVHLFQGRRSWLCKCVFSLKLIKLEHRCAINQYQISSSCLLSLEWNWSFLDTLCSNFWKILVQSRAIDDFTSNCLYFGVRLSAWWLDNSLQLILNLFCASQL